MPTPFPGDLETLLVVEDNPMVLGFLVTYLVSAGFTVLSAGSPEEARHIEAHHKGPIHLLVSDAIMRNTCGPALAGELVARRAEMRVMLISGSPEDRRLLNYHGPFLEKPFLKNELLEMVNEALRGKAYEAFRLNRCAGV